MFGQSLTLGAVVYAAPLNGAFEFTPMVGGSQSQPQGQTQLNGFHYGNGTFHIWKNGRVRPVPHQVRPRRAGWPLRRNNRENDRHYARQGLHPNQLSHYKGQLQIVNGSGDVTITSSCPHSTRKPSARVTTASSWPVGLWCFTSGEEAESRIWNHLARPILARRAVHLFLGRRPYV